jgi:hypothetical protein
MATEGLHLSRIVTQKNPEDPMILEMELMKLLKSLLPNITNENVENEDFDILMSAIEYIDYLRSAITKS